MTTVDSGGLVTERPVIGPSPLLTGDRFRHELASGAGWGDPLEREPAAVLADVRNGLVSRERAQADYGVVVRPDETLDLAATAAERQVRPRRRDLSFPVRQTFQRATRGFQWIVWNGHRSIRGLGVSVGTSAVPDRRLSCALERLAHQTRD